MLTTILGIVAILCAVWVIYDVLTAQKRMSGAQKLIWIIFAVIFSIFTAIVYYIVQKK